MLDIRYWKVFQSLEKTIFSDMRLAMVLGNGEAGIIMLKNDDVYSIGSGQLLGLDGVYSNEIPMKIPQLSGQHVKGSYSGAKFAVALTKNGQVFSWGSNQYGQLGLGEYISSSDIPIRLNFPKNDIVTEVACGGCHAVALTESGKVYAWGWNGDMQVSSSNSMSVWTPKYVLNEDGLGRSKVISVACGWSSSFALRSNGQVWAWGYNYVKKLGGNYIPPTLIPLGFPVQKVACGEENVLVLDTQGYIHVWGFDGKNCKVEPTKIAEELGPVTDIAATWRSSLNVIQYQSGGIYILGEWLGHNCEHPKPTRFSSIDIVFSVHQGIMCRPVAMDNNNDGPEERGIPLVNTNIPLPDGVENLAPHMKLLELLSTAVRHAELSLLDDTKALLTSMITVDNALDVFQVANKLNIEDLERRSLEAMAPPNFGKIVQSDAPGELVKLIAIRLANLDGFKFTALLT